MKLYNQNTDKIENLKVIPTAEANYIADKLSDAELNALGYYKLSIASTPDRRYYTYTKSGLVVGTVYEVTYIATERPLYDVQTRMLDKLRSVYEYLGERPKIDTGLGYYVYGGRDDIEELVDAKDNAETTILDADDNIQNVTGVSYTAIATAIKAHRAMLRNRAKFKVSEIKAFTTIEQCINYEHEPYDYTVTQEDVDNDIDGTLTLGQIITRYRDNITDWQL